MTKKKIFGEWEFVVSSDGIIFAGIVYNSARIVVNYGIIQQGEWHQLQYTSMLVQTANQTECNDNLQSGSETKLLIHSVD